MSEQFLLHGHIGSSVVKNRGECVGAAYAAVAAWLVLLAAISFRQTFIYHDLETLYRDTIAKNPRGTIAYSNLAVLLNNRGDTDEAIDMARELLRLAPDDPLGHTNLAVFLLTDGKRRGARRGHA